MNDHLFELLINFFEKQLSQLNKKDKLSKDSDEDSLSNLLDGNKDTYFKNIKSAQETSIRVFTFDEQMKFTKASYQFITRMLLWGIISPESMESIIEQLLFSESRFVTLEETKWTIRNALASQLNSAQLAFLDLVLYQKEDNLPLH